MLLQRAKPAFSAALSDIGFHGSPKRINALHYKPTKRRLSWKALIGNTKLISVTRQGGLFTRIVKVDITVEQVGLIINRHRYRKSSWIATAGPSYQEESSLISPAAQVITANASGDGD